MPLQCTGLHHAQQWWGKQPLRSCQQEASRTSAVLRQAASVAIGEPHGPARDKIALCTVPLGKHLRRICHQEALRTFTVLPQWPQVHNLLCCVTCHAAVSDVQQAHAQSLHSQPRQAAVQSVPASGLHPQASNSHSASGRAADAQLRSESCSA